MAENKRKKAKAKMNVAISGGGEWHESASHNRRNVIGMAEAAAAAKIKRVAKNRAMKIGDNGGIMAEAASMKAKWRRNGEMALSENGRKPGERREKLKSNERNINGEHGAWLAAQCNLM